MQLVERHVINQGHQDYQEIDLLAFLSKNLYNIANYLIRQEFINKGKYLNYNVIQKLLQKQADYKSLPAKVSQQILMLLDKNWQSFFEAIKEYGKNPEKFSARPKLPKYKDKLKGRNVLVYTVQAISKRALTRQQLINPSQTSLAVKTTITYDKLAQVRIVPKLNHYAIEVVYNRLPEDRGLNKSHVAGIDLGVNNLATITSNKLGFKPIIVNGKPLKSINQFFNKSKAELFAIIAQTTRRIQKLCTKRNFKVDNYLHKASRFIINQLISNDMGTLIIGKNDGWKHGSHVGKRNNQNFVQLPHERFIHQLKYKAELVGIKVIITEESYTSKASFLDSDTIPTYQQGIKHTFSGKRIQRGMYKSQSGKKINADCNGSYNIIRKVVPNAFSNGIEGVVVHPAKVTLPN